MINSRPRVALVGCGSFASAAHVPALQHLERAGLLELVGLCSRSEASLSRVGDQLGSRKIKRYKELDAVLQDPEVDLVDLVLPISSMPEAIRASLRVGKHVISEKPCAPTVEICLDLMNDHGKLDCPPFWAVAENWRFKRTTKLIEAIVKNGEIGEVYFIDFTFVTTTPTENLGWRGSPDYPGGHLLDSGVHFAALLRRVAGEVERVSASISQRRAYLPPADSATAVINFEGGAEGMFRVSFAAPEPDARRAILSITGSKGALNVDFDFHRHVIQIRDRIGERLIDVPEDSWGQGGVQELFSHCFEALRFGTPLRSSPSEALRDVGVIEAMLGSNRTGEPAHPAMLHPALHGVGRRVAAYNKSWTFRPRYAADCGSTAEVRSAVLEAAAAGLRVRAMGMANSWASQLATPDVCISLRGLNRIRAVDAGRKAVLVDAGVRLGDLTRTLSSYQLSLPSLPFLQNVTVGGAVSVAMHGTSPRWGTLSDFVTSMKVVLASGEVRTFGPQCPPEELRAARVAVGMLGVIVQLELEAIEMPWVRLSETVMDVPTFLDRRSSILTEYEHVWGHWMLGEDQIRLKCLESRDQPARGFHRYVLGDNACWNLSPRSRVAARSGRLATGILNRARTILKLPPGPRPDSRQVWLSMQYGVAASEVETAISNVSASDFAKLNPGRTIELKFLKGENRSFLGPNAGSDSVLFNIWWEVEEFLKDNVFDEFERTMRRFQARPHWGKLHRVPDIEYMKAAYPRWADFEAVRSRLDPTGVFSFFPGHSRRGNEMPNLNAPSPRSA